NVAIERERRLGGGAVSLGHTSKYQCANEGRAKDRHRECEPAAGSESVQRWRTRWGLPIIARFSSEFHPSWPQTTRTCAVKKSIGFPKIARHFLGRSGVLTLTTTPPLGAPSACRVVSLTTRRPFRRAW